MATVLQGSDPVEMVKAKNTRYSTGTCFLRGFAFSLEEAHIEISEFQFGAQLFSNLLAKCGSSTGGAVGPVQVVPFNYEQRWFGAERHECRFAAHLQHV